MNEEADVGGAPPTDVCMQTRTGRLGFEPVLKTYGEYSTSLEHGELFTVPH